LKRALLFIALKLFILVILFVAGWNLILYPFEIPSKGYATTNQLDGHLEEASRTFVYHLQRLNTLPVSLVNVELTGYSGLILGKVKFDDKSIQCDAKIITDVPVNPNAVILHYELWGLELKQIIKDTPWWI